MYLSNNKVSQHLGQLIWIWFRSSRHQNKNKMHRVDIVTLSLIPVNLQVRLCQEVFGPMLQTHPLFHQYLLADPWAFSCICRTAVSEMTAEQGQDLFTQGERATAMYFVDDGN